MKTNKDIQKFIQNQLSRSPALLRNYIQDLHGNEYAKRSIYIRLLKYFEDFIKGAKSNRLVCVSGLRGVGKTTVLAQLYFHYLSRFSDNMLYVSVDRIVNEFNSDLYTFLEEYEKFIGTPFEELNRDLFLFIDEIHFDAKWDSVLKSLYDRTNRIFVICTGSSALSLQTSSDLSRRIAFEKLYPMNFTEYLLLKSKSRPPLFKKSKFPVPGLKNSIKQALFYSSTASEAFRALEGLKKNVSNYWRSIDSLEIDNYLRYASMPYALTIEDPMRLQSMTDQQLDRVLNKDLFELGKFDPGTLSICKNLLLMLSSSSEVSLNSIAKSLTGISPVTLSNVLEAMENAELLIRVYPYGSAYKKVRKPSKYYFMSPALRHALLTLVEGAVAFEKFKGLYLEDIVSLTLYREFAAKLSSPIFYDSSEKGADFVLSLPSRKIAIEVGYSKKSFGQVKRTLEKIKGNYGFVVSTSSLNMGYSDALKIPLKYFLLI